MKFLPLTLVAYSAASFDSTTLGNFDWDTSAEAPFALTDAEHEAMLARIDDGEFDQPVDTMELDWLEPVPTQIDDIDLFGTEIDAVTGIIPDELNRDIEEDETTSESSDSEEGVEEMVVTTIPPKRGQKRTRDEATSASPSSFRMRGRPSRASRMRGRPSKATTAPANTVTMLGQREKIPDEKPGRFVFRINLSGRSMALVDRSKDASAQPGKRVRFAEENEVAYFV